MSTSVADDTRNQNAQKGPTLAVPALGVLLRDWRRKRRMSQAELALDADISVKHLCSIETGVAPPSRQVLLHLAERLDVPLRERNRLLVAAGCPPAYPESAYNAPSLELLRREVETLLAAYNPNPAMVIDRRWTMLSANRSLPRLAAGVEPMLLRPPVNVLRLTLHPGGLAPRIVNLAEWRSAMILRLRRQLDASSDHVLRDFLEEIRNYPLPPGEPVDSQSHPGIAVPFRLATIDGEMSFLNTTTTVSMPTDITVSELSIEAFLPADASTAAMVRQVSQFGTRYEFMTREPALCEPALG